MSAPNQPPDPTPVGAIRRVAHRLLEQPAVYDAVQQLAGLPHTYRRLQALLAETAGHSVLDVGGGTGLYLSAFPPTAGYLWLDNDRHKLRGLLQRAGNLPALLGDGTRIGLGARSVDYATCIAVTHHLDDAQLPRLVDELARVVRRKIIVLDALASDALTSRLLWHYDQGSHPRTADQITTAFSRRFAIEHTEQYAIYHRYLVLVAQARTEPSW